MIYNAASHSLTEDNGQLVAIFDPSIRADKAFGIADNLRDLDYIKSLEEALDNIQSLVQHSFKGCKEDLVALLEEIKDEAFWSK